MHLYLVALWTTLKERWNALRREPEAGYTTEMVLATALLVVAALAIIGIIVVKVTERANGIPL